MKNSGNKMVILLFAIVCVLFSSSRFISASDAISTWSSYEEINVDLEKLQQGDIVYENVIETYHLSDGPYFRSLEQEDAIVDELVEVLVFMNITCEGNSRFHMQIMAETQRAFFLMKGISASATPSGSAGYGEGDLYHTITIPIIRVGASGSMYCSEFYSGTQSLLVQGRHWAANGLSSNFTKSFRWNAV